MRPISRTLQIPALPIDWRGQGSVEAYTVNAICYFHGSRLRHRGLGFDNILRSRFRHRTLTAAPEIPVEHALRQITRGRCRVNSSERTYIVWVGTRRLIQQIHNRLTIPRIEAPGIVVLLVRGDDPRRMIWRRPVDGITDGLRRLLAVVEARNV
jgi:hypothetical protein